ncbi:MAG: IPT/TIG domain-containing protein [Bryobacteraceae bacterium]
MFYRLTNSLAVVMFLAGAALAADQPNYIQSWTILSECGARPQGALPFVFFDSMWDQNCTQQFKRSNQSAPFWDVVGITGPGNQGWYHPLAPLRGAAIDPDSSAGMPAIDPTGQYLLFIYQPNVLSSVDVVPGGGFTYYLGGCKLPCSASSFKSLANPVTWSGRGFPGLAGVLDPTFAYRNADGSMDVNHILLTVMESGGANPQWAQYIVTLDWSGEAPAFISATRWVPPSDAAWAGQLGSLSGSCQKYMKADAAMGSPASGTVFIQADLLPYSSDFSNCKTRGADPTQSGIFRFDLANAPYGSNWQQLWPPVAVLPTVYASGGGFQDTNSYGEFPTYMQDTGKLLFGAVLLGSNIGTLSMTSNVHMELMVMNVDGTNWRPLTNLNTPGAAMYQAFASRYGYAGIARPQYDAASKTVITAVATGDAGENYSQSTNKIVRWSLDYPGSPVYNTYGAPVISSVVNGAGFQPAITAGSWVTVSGSGLSNSTRAWRANELVAGTLPDQLDGVSVKINGKPAWVYYVSPTQLNVLAPDDAASGQISVQTTSSSLPSNEATATLQPVSPALFLWVNKYAVATRADYSYAIADGVISGTTTRPAKAGETIILWGTGLGATNPPVPSGQTVPSDRLYAVPSPPAVTIGGLEAKVLGAALTPASAGLYQIAIEVPASLQKGDQPVVLNQSGSSSPAGVYLTIKN